MRPQNRATLSLPSGNNQRRTLGCRHLIRHRRLQAWVSATIRRPPLLHSPVLVSSIVLIAELTFAAMDEDGLSEVSFTALATRALGANAGAVVAVVYACLSFSLLIACVAGIGSIAVQRFQSLNPVLVHAACPLIVGAVIGFFPFKAIDAVNRSLCALMLFSISALIAVGLSVGRRSLLGSFTHATWRVDAILPAVPVTVLTLGFHVITPFVCKIVGHTVYDARRAILVGGAVPLAMVLAWNAVVLGLAGRQPDLNSVGCADPIRLLLSVNSSALPAVQGFAFTALATSLIGYAVSLPKQVSDTVGLVSAITGSGLSVGLASQGGRVGFVVFSEGKRSGSLGWASFNSSRSKCVVSHDTSLGESGSGGILMCVVLGSAVLIASFFPMAFSVALDFAGVYANCFLFGVLPPFNNAQSKSSSLGR
ncbi:hypothetical protein QJS10_CPA05g00590 [Acorus calamus]|uniref:Uncharacterized protein n=1 Tax=Acorus calamus TaxID=4465 RepID=A0AAV9ERG8_ACOCL|nr:hypothetical protein QJS10_CPA05g00590 [Acorus calamus]